MSVLPGTPSGAMLAQPPGRTWKLAFRTPLGRGARRRMPEHPGETGSMRVQLLGGPALYCRDQAVPISPFQGCLLALVYGSANEGMSRPEIAWLLWESDDTAPARHRISQILYGIRKRAGVACFDEPSTDTLRGLLPSDLRELQRSVHDKRLDGVLSAAEREFLPSLSPPTPSFAHWLDRRRTTIRGQVRELAATVLAEASSAADWKLIASASTILLQLDPSNEKLLRRMLEVSALQRSREELDAMIESYRERYSLLTGEEWRPEGETLELLERIAHVQADTPVRHTTPPPSLVGRTEEVKHLHRAVATPTSHVQFTVVVGEAGIGKTRLIRETMAKLRLSGATVLECGSSPLQRDLPLHSLIGALSDPGVLAKLQELDEPWQSALGVLLPGLSITTTGAPPVLDAHGTSLRLMEALYQLLLKVCANGSVVLFLDDLQWLDKTTLCALEFLRAVSGGVAACSIRSARRAGAGSERADVSRTNHDEQHAHHARRAGRSFS